MNDDDEELDMEEVLGIRGSELLQLTDFETGRIALIRVDAINTVIPLQAHVYSDGNETPIELGERTRIDTVNGVELVRETSDEVAAMIAGAAR